MLLICNYCYDFNEVAIFLLDNYHPNSEFGAINESPGEQIYYRFLERNSSDTYQITFHFGDIMIQ